MDFLQLSQREARAFARTAVRLNPPFLPSVSAALAYHGYVQLDPLNICGRVHDLILRNRVVDYREGDLLRSVHGQGNRDAVPKSKPTRIGFEHYIPGEGILAAWPLSAYPYVRAYLDRIQPTVTRHLLSPPEEILADKLVSEISDRGPLTSDDFEHEGRGQTAWGSYGRLAKIVLEKLFAAGRLMISGRRGFRRVYDLPLRVIQPLAPSQLPSERELNRWRLLSRLRQRRLVSFRRAELEELSDVIQPIEIEGKIRACCLKEDIPLLNHPSNSVLPSSCELLAPLDPLIYDRKFTRAVWNFDFTWEVYTPAAVRKRGYYSLPVLTGLELVGDIEPKADRKNGRLRVASRRVKRGYSTAAAVQTLATFLGLR